MPPLCCETKVDPSIADGSFYLIYMENANDIKTMRPKHNPIRRPYPSGRDHDGERVCGRQAWRMEVRNWSIIRLAPAKELISLFRTCCSVLLSIDSTAGLW